MIEEHFQPTIVECSCEVDSWYDIKEELRDAECDGVTESAQAAESNLNPRSASNVHLAGSMQTPRSCDFFSGAKSANSQWTLESGNLPDGCSRDLDELLLEIKTETVNDDLSMTFCDDDDEKSERDLKPGFSPTFRPLPDSDAERLFADMSGYRDVLGDLLRSPVAEQSRAQPQKLFSDADEVKHSYSEEFRQNGIADCHESSDTSARFQSFELPPVIDVLDNILCWIHDIKPVSVRVERCDRFLTDGVCRASDFRIGDVGGGDNGRGSGDVGCNGGGDDGSITQQRSAIGKKDASGVKQPTVRLERCDRFLTNGVFQTSQSRFDLPVLAGGGQQWTKINEKGMNVEKQQFKCEHCGHRFLQHCRLRIHQDGQRLTDKMKCPLCERWFWRRLRLEQHIDRHLMVEPLRCDECSYKTVRAPCMQYHARSHRKVRRTQLRSPSPEQSLAADKRSCNECGKPFTTIAASRSHIGRSRKCPYCGKQFHIYDLFRRHLASSHCLVLPFKCGECLFTTTRYGCLTWHAKTVHCSVPKRGNEVELRLRDSLPKCPDCDRSFQLKQDLGDHLMGREKFSEPRKCPHCSNSFIHKVLFKIHLGECLNTERMKCGECEFTTRRETCLQYHVMTHNQCKDCGRRLRSIFAKSRGKCFPCSSAYARLPCPDCGRQFDTAYAYHKHVHGVNLAPAAQQCVHCGERFKFANDLNSHLITAHQSGSVQKCRHCNFSSARTGCVHYHMQTSHDNLCGLCPATFLSAFELVAHRWRHHRRSMFPSNVWSAYRCVMLRSSCGGCTCGDRKQHLQPLVGVCTQYFRHTFVGYELSSLLRSLNSIVVGSNVTDEVRAEWCANFTLTGTPAPHGDHDYAQMLFEPFKTDSEKPQRVVLFDPFKADVEEPEPSFSEPFESVTEKPKPLLSEHFETNTEKSPPVLSSNVRKANAEKLQVSVFSDSFKTYGEKLPPTLLLNPLNVNVEKPPVLVFSDPFKTYVEKSLPAQHFGVLKADAEKPPVSFFSVSFNTHEEMFYAYSMKVQPSKVLFDVLKADGEKPPPLSVLPGMFKTFAEESPPALPFYPLKAHGEKPVQIVSSRVALLEHDYCLKMSTD